MMPSKSARAGASRTDKLLLTESGKIWREDQVRGPVCKEMNGQERHEVHDDAYLAS